MSATVSTRRRRSRDAAGQTVLFDDQQTLNVGPARAPSAGLAPGGPPSGNAPPAALAQAGPASGGAPSAVLAPGVVPPGGVACEMPAVAAPKALARALSDDQERVAARRSGPLLLAAGAGSGKTAVLVERFVRAVREDGIAPARILAITFTERAAGELRERVRAQLLALGERTAARDTEGAPIGTFHGFCARLLRTHALAANLDPDFAILDDAAATRLQLLAFRRALAALQDLGRPARAASGHDSGRSARAASGHDSGPSGRGAREAVDLIAAYGADRLRAMVFGVYAELRSRGVAEPRLPAAALAPNSTASAGQPAAEGDGQHAQDDEQRARRACALLDDTLRCFAREYAALKRARGALDFDDLELRAHDLLAGNPAVRDAWTQRLELLMVDEFQDTNPRQLALLALIERDNLFTVGDELQSIYSFRHADPELFRTRRSTLQRSGAALLLDRNFRATAPLLDAVNTVFGARLGDAYTPLQRGREQPALSECGREQSIETEPAVELLLTDRCGWEQSPHAAAIAGGLPAAPLWRQAEARLLAQRVCELIAGGVAAHEVAVLLRATGDLPVYERALQQHGLRTLAAVGGFWGHQQVADLLAWLRVLANPLDELALYGVLASPLVGISSDGLALLALRAHAERATPWVTLRHTDGELYTELAPTDRERLARFVQHFANERRLVATLSVADLLLRALASTGYEQHVLALDWGARRLANIHKLLRLARRFEAAEGRGLRGFLDHAAHHGTFAQLAEPDAPSGGAAPDAVQLMTVHAAKGLEFGVVCVADLGRSTNGTPPDLLLDGERVGLRLAALDGSPPRASLDYDELHAERRAAQDAEEERIVYVAMTRARDRLLLSGAADFARWPNPRPGGPPIAWLAPTLAAAVPECAQTLERPVLDLAIGDCAATLRCRLNSPQNVGKVLDVAALRTFR
jgi:ATP-dependent helicase/nuclease subunit A